MESTDTLTPERIKLITAYVDLEAPPSVPSALVLFGTNQAAPVALAADRHRQGLAPLIIATGGVNRHNGIVEGREFRRLLIERGVPDDAIRVEDRSANTWQNIEFGEPHIREALALGLPLTAVTKWYHRRAIHVLRTLLPDVEAFHTFTWEPIYDDQLVTRETWPTIPGGRRRVLREWQEVQRRVADGSFKGIRLVDRAWR